jgi:hypothetical protein
MVKRQRNSAKCRGIVIDTQLKEDRQGRYLLCHVCEGRIDPIAKPGSWQADHHPIPFAFDGPDTAENLRPICAVCWPAKNGEDAGEISYRSEGRMKHLGIKVKKPWRRF